MYQLTESQGDESHMAKRILEARNIRTVAVSTDATASDFTSFNVYNSQTNELLSSFRAEDIVQQRNFMAALGARGPGLFTQQPKSAVESSSSTDGNTRIKHLLQRQQIYNRMSQNSQLSEICRKVPKSFQEVLQMFPSEFYLPNLKLPAPLLPGVRLHDYNPALQESTASFQPRKVEFRAPHGPPVNYPTMIGCGSSAGLEAGQIAVWDQENEFYYFLDCNCKTVTANEQRKRSSFKPNVRKTQITIQRGQSEKNLTLPECDPTIVRAAAERAARKLHGCVIRACGKNGKNGMSAIPASGGKRGSDGSQKDILSERVAHGGNGENGRVGDNGRHAEAGEDGGIGKNIIVEVYGDSNELGIDGTFQSVARLGGEECEEVLLVNCSGGDGGEGGRGGDGGKGGDGGNGERGQNGGDGGHGAAGGAGGRGGNGGFGGSAGQGGNCIIKTTDPKLLMLVEVDCNAGEPGKAGNGGKGGRGGKMGLGGAAGNSKSVADIYDGLQGKPGNTGLSGEAGIDGETGFTNTPGNLQWVITTQDGEEIAAASTRFEVEVLTMKITSSSERDIYEPHQQIQVAGIVVANSGGLPLPAGAKVSIPSTETIRFEQTAYTLPQLQPSEQFVVPMTFHGRIVDDPSPNTPGPLDQVCQFAPRIELLGRPFNKSLEQTLPVHYPVKLAYALAKKNVHKGEVTTLEVGIENLSNIQYGASNTSGGSVLVHILLDPRLRLLGLSPTNSQISDNNFEASYDPNCTNSVFILVKHLQPKSTITIPITVQLEEDVCVGESCRWQTELYLRGKLIEYNTAVMRVAPSYSPSNSISSSATSVEQLADVLLIKSDSLGEQEMKFWQRIFDLLEVSYDYWDSSITDPDASSSTQLLPPFQQEYRGKLVVYPHCDLTKLTADDIVGHFKSNEDSKSSRDSSMLIFMDTPTPDSLEDYIQHNTGIKTILAHICANEKRVEVAPELYSGRHLVSPGTILPFDWTLQKAQRLVLKKLQQEMPAHVPIITGQSNVLKRQGLTYSYGKLNIRRCPLPRTANFQCVDGATGQMIGMGTDDPYLTENSKDIPLASHFGQVFLATLAALPFHLKLNLLRQSVAVSSPQFVQFHLPNGTILTKNELVAISLARDIVDETLAGSTDLYHMTTLTKHLKEAGQTLTSADEKILTQVFDLIKREAGLRQSTLGKSSSQVSGAVKHLLALCSSATHHLSSSSSSSLPLLSQLQSKITVLRPHQLTTDELADISSTH